jgi:hypothetical protein
MPAISLVICVYKETAMLDRLLRDAADCYDDLVVVHDGPAAPDESERIKQLVVQRGGRFFVRPRAFQQEPHWPFAWEQARHDWILRLDADELLDEEMKQWLRRFRSEPEPAADASGYTCIWPLWNGTRAITQRWPAGRIFLFHKKRVRFFGMAEQVPIADDHFEALSLVLQHRPHRKSYGLASLLFRRQAFLWRSVIAQSLLGRPTDLACWRWTDEQWPEVWEEIRRRPMRTALYRLLAWPILGMRDYWHHERKLIPSAAISGGVHHCLIALKYWWVRKS